MPVRKACILSCENDEKCNPLSLPLHILLQLHAIISTKRIKTACESESATVRLLGVEGGGGGALGETTAAGVDGLVAELLLDAEELVVLWSSAHVHGTGVWSTGCNEQKWRLELRPAG